MSKTRNIVLSAFLLLSLAILSISFAMAGTMVTPASSATLGGTVALNASGTNLQNCTFYAGSSLTANTTWTQIAFSSNQTVLKGSINTTFDSASLEDATDYSFNATCRNLTNSLTAQTLTTSITVDNTVPVAPSSLTPTSSSDGSASFSSTVTGTRTTACTLLFTGANPGQPSYTMTHSGSTCTYSLSAMPGMIYTYYVRASDGTNTTDSATQQLNVDYGKSGGKFLQQQGVIPTPSQSGQALAVTDDTLIPGIPNLVLIIFAIVAVLVIVAIAKKK